MTKAPFVFHPGYAVRSTPHKRFPVAKAQAIADRLVADGLVARNGFHAPEPAPISWLEGAHAPDYVARVLARTLSPAEERRIGFALTPEIVDRSRLACGGAVLTAELALQRGAACNTAGGSHHAGPDAGAGYCIFNDVAVAIRALLARGRIRRAVVVDLDVHQGDGTALIFQSDPNVFTFSMHCAANFPARKQSGDLDAALPSHMSDADYLVELKRLLPKALEAAKPDLAFYIAGVDVHAADKLGRLDLTDDGLKAREDYVFAECLARGVPVAGVLGGGYDDDIDALARRHAILHHACAAALRRAVT